jgi:hypothetical protein
MRRGTFLGTLSLLAVLLLNACGSAPPAPADAVVVTADARALQYGSNAPEVLNNPRLANQIRALFGPDWNPPSVSYGAPAFFPDFSAIRMVRVAGREVVAIKGCVPTGCSLYQGLLMITSPDQLQARLDEGGFVHYYDFGPSPGSPASRSMIDGAWNAIQVVERR